jgi:hypothetical protein
MELVKKYVKDISSVIFYSAGPPKMVVAIKNLLLDSGVPQERVRTEEFDGY